jgi:hypothetical protein
MTEEFNGLVWSSNGCVIGWNTEAGGGEKRAVKKNADLTKSGIITVRTLSHGLDFQKLNPHVWPIHNCITA